MPHLKDIMAKFLPNLGQKWQKTDSFQEFYHSLVAMSTSIPSLLADFLHAMVHSSFSQNMPFSSQKCWFWQQTVKQGRIIIHSQNLWYFDKIKSSWKLMISFCYFQKKNWIWFWAWPLPHLFGGVPLIF